MSSCKIGLSGDVKFKSIKPKERQNEPILQKYTLIVLSVPTDKLQQLRNLEQQVMKAIFQYLLQIQ